MNKLLFKINKQYKNNKNELNLLRKQQGSGKKKTKNRKIHTGPRGGKFYINKGHKIYVK